MPKFTRNKVSYNVDEALDDLLESDEEDLGQLEDDNGTAWSSTYSEYKDDDNVSITGVDQDVKQVKFAVPEKRPKCKRNIGPMMSLDTFLNKTNYDAFDPPIPEECFESNIDKTPYKWTASTVSSGRCNTANITPLRPTPPKRVRHKKEPIDIWTNFFTDDMTTTVLNNTNKKIMAFIEQLPEEYVVMINTNTLRSYIRRVSCFFWYLISKGLAWIKFSKTKRTF